LFEASAELTEAQAEKRKGNPLARWEGVKRPSRSKGERINLIRELCSNSEQRENKKRLCRCKGVGEREYR
jgi:hypothetical protein